jgi:cytochrome c oxidase subunit 2
VGCHDIRGTVANGNYAPDLTHFGSRTTLAAGILPNNRENVFRWLRDPQAIKPGTLMPNLNLSRDDATALAAYLDSLK